MKDASPERARPGSPRSLAVLAGLLIVLAGLAWWAGVGGHSVESVAPLPRGDVANQQTGQASGLVGRPAQLTEAKGGDLSAVPAQLAERLPTDQVRVLSLKVVRRADKLPIREGVKVILTTGPEPGVDVLDARTADGDGLCRFEVPGLLLTPDAGLLIVWQPWTFVPRGDTHTAKAVSDRVARTWVAVDSLKAEDGEAVPVVQLDTGCRLSVLVLDSSRTPVARVHVSMESGAPNVMTDAAGLAVLEDVPRGRGVVAWHKQGFRDGTAPVDVGADDSTKSMTAVIVGDGNPK